MPGADMLLGVPVVVLVPAVVEGAKRAGVPTRWAGLCAIVAAFLLVMLADLYAGGGSAVWGWLAGGLVYGLAAAGLYSQVRQARPGGEGG